MHIEPLDPTDAREAAGLSVSQLAAAVGCSRRTMQRYCNGHGRPDAAELVAMAEALGVGQMGVARLAAWYAR